MKSAKHYKMLNGVFLKGLTNAISLIQKKKLLNLFIFYLNNHSIPTLHTLKFNFNSIELQNKKYFNFLHYKPLTLYT